MCNVLALLPLEDMRLQHTIILKNKKEEGGIETVSVDNSPPSNSAGVFAVRDFYFGLEKSL